MKKLLLLPTMLLLAAAAFAQNTERVRERLASPETGTNGRRASVNVYESGNAGSAVARGEAASASATAAGFRIVIFFDNGPTARSEAERISSSFRDSYSDVRCDIRYENPYFKVLAGNCVTSEEAVILLGRIRSSYPEAYIMREDIALQNFITPERDDADTVPDYDGDTLKPEKEA